MNFTGCNCDASIPKPLASLAQANRLMRGEPPAGKHP